MKKFALTMLLAALAVGNCLAQDIITTKTGEDILAEVLEVGPKEIKYLKYDNKESPTYSILKSDLIMIRYANGTKDLFTDEKIYPEDMFLAGQEDALVYYQGRNSGAGWTGVTTVLFSPLIGIVPAVIFSSTNVSDRNLLYKDKELMQNKEYYTGYTQRAKKTKKIKVWGTFGICTGVWLLFFVAAQAN